MIEETPEQFENRMEEIRLKVIVERLSKQVDETNAFIKNAYQQTKPKESFIKAQPLHCDGTQVPSTEKNKFAGIFKQIKISEKEIRDYCFNKSGIKEVVDDKMILKSKHYENTIKEEK